VSICTELDEVQTVPKIYVTAFFLSPAATAHSIGQEVKQRRWWSPQASGIWCIAIFEVSQAAHACSYNCSRLRLNCDGTSAETRFRLSAKRTNSFKSAGASVQSTTGSRGVRISGSNAGYTTFRGSVKGTGYPLHSPLPLPCVTVYHHISTGL
jgi:hypothetical protein